MNDNHSTYIVADDRVKKPVMSSRGTINGAKQTIERTTSRAKAPGDQGLIKPNKEDLLLEAERET